MYTLNGTFFTVEEAADKAGVTHSIACRIIKKNGMTPLRVGMVMLLTQEEVDQLAEYAATNEEMNKQFITVRQAALRLGISVDQMSTMAIDIPHEVDARGRVQFKREDIQKIEKSEEWASLKKARVSMAKSVFKTKEG